MSSDGQQEQGAAEPTPEWFDEPRAGGAEAPEAAEAPEPEGEPPPPIEVEDDEEEAVAEARAAAGTSEVDQRHYLKLPPPRHDRRPPAWAAGKVPGAPFRFAKGIEALFVRVRAELTAARHKGDRVLIVWGLSDADERLAYGRAMGDPNRAVSELAKQTVRAFDGHAVDWSGKPGPGNIDQLWRELGGKGRGQLVRLYTQLHVYDREEQQDFFENCVVRLTTG